MSTTELRPALMVQGTTSDAGKSLLVAGLCRVLARRGVRVAPFKPQNLALNSDVTAEGGEIGRATALQAAAARVAAHVDMNPVLLKPSSDCRAQVIVHGRVASDLDAADYQRYQAVAMAAVLASWRRLRERYQVVVVEGAGSPAEINLRDRDIANMGFAEAVDCPVVIVADIDRGGVFAHLVGTLQLLSASERRRVVGFVINRFRGELALLQPGLDWLERHTGKPVLGVLPYLPGLRLDAEDALRRPEPAAGAAARFQVVVPVLPRIANHTDFDPLCALPQLDCRFIGAGQPLPAADLIILPGSKNVRADLASLRAQGWDRALARHLRYGGKLLGICGGYQMLGRRIDDPLGVEDAPGSAPGLGWLPLTTRLAADKQLRRVRGRLWCGAAVEGYEVHCGRSELAPRAGPFLVGEDGHDEGAFSDDGLVAGTYLHGLFDRAAACRAILDWAGCGPLPTTDRGAERERDLERLADCVERHLDLARLLGGGAQHWGATP